MARIKISLDFRARLSEKLMDLGNYAAVGLVIGQLVTAQPLSQNTLIAGIVGTVILYLTAYVVSS